MINKSEIAFSTPGLEIGRGCIQLRDQTINLKDVLKCELRFSDPPYLLGGVPLATGLGIWFFKVSGIVAIKAALTLSTVVAGLVAAIGVAAAFKFKIEWDKSGYRL
jgi:hypothetical protein